MNIPIDCDKIPYRKKYLDETFVLEPWVIFGIHDDGSVDVGGVSGDVFVKIHPESAKTIVDARELFLAIIARELT